MKKLLAVGFLALILTGCSDTGSDYEPIHHGPQITEDNGLYHERVTLDDGQVIDCMVWKGPGRGGLDCNWG